MSDIVFNPNQLLWVERFRPTVIDDCILPQRIKDNLKNYVVKGDFPCLMLSGSPGVGKTTIAQALCHELGMDTMLINISNERGIDVLRTTISSFASSVSLDGGLKCIILDEFDGASEILQRAMRAAIEEYSINCRFIITCNHPNRILDAIHSRTAQIDVSIPKADVMDVCKSFLARMCDILKNENVAYERPAVAKLIQKGFPDFRAIINRIQALSVNGKITMEAVEAESKEVSITKLTKTLKDKSFKDMRQWVASNANSDPNILFRKVYDSLNDIMQPSSIPEVVVILAQYQHYAVTAIDPEINICACLTEIMSVANFQ